MNPKGAGQKFGAGVIFRLGGSKKLPSMTRQGASTRVHFNSR
jgi:hypothetical protein